MRGLGGQRISQRSLVHDLGYLISVPSWPYGTTTLVDHVPIYMVHLYTCTTILKYIKEMVHVKCIYIDLHVFMLNFNGFRPRNVRISAHLSY